MRPSGWHISMDFPHYRDFVWTHHSILIEGRLAGVTMGNPSSEAHYSS